MRAVYLSPMRYGSNAAVDAVAHGLDNGLSGHGIDMVVATADFADSAWRSSAEAVVRSAVDGGADALVIWVIDPVVPADAVAYARRSGVPVVTLERPHFAVDASVVYPNFNHGVYMTEHLATLLRPGGRVAVIGAPDVVDDIELMIGLLHGLRSSGLSIVNDPEDPRYKNSSDMAPGGRVATANVLEDFPELDGLVPFNDETMLGAIDALRSARRLGEVKSVSRNGTPAAVEMVRQGLHHGTWDIEAPAIGHAVADLVARVLGDGEDLDGLCVSSPIGRMITAEVIPRWVPWSEQVPQRPLTAFT